MFWIKLGTSKWSFPTISRIFLLVVESVDGLMLLCHICFSMSHFPFLLIFGNYCMDIPMEVSCLIHSWQFDTFKSFSKFFLGATYFKLVHSLWMLDFYCVHCEQYFGRYISSGYICFWPVYCAIWIFYYEQNGFFMLGAMFY